MMHSRTKSTSSRSSSPTKRVSLGRTDSSRSGKSDLASGCFPSMATITKEAHASTNAFYAQLLEAQKRKEDGIESKADHEQTRQSTNSAVNGRAKSEEPITALTPPPSPTDTAMHVPDTSATATPRRKRPGGLQLVPDHSEDVVPTQRAHIEARKEKKVMSMLARDVPETPAAVTFQDDPTTITYDAKSRIAAKKPAGSTSPKKKFLGLNISVPNFMSGGAEPAEALHETFKHLPLPVPLPPPPQPPVSKKPAVAAVIDGRGRAALGSEGPAQEEGVSHLPSKVRQLKSCYDGLTMVSDSPTLGCQDGSNPTRSVSEGAAAALQGLTLHGKSQGAGEEVKRSKSVIYHRDADAETIPPTPLPKDTPPKVVVQKDTPVKAAPRDKPGFRDAQRNKASTPVKGVQHLRNDYLDLIQKSPSVYSLYGDIHRASALQPARPPGRDTAKGGEDAEVERLKPTVFDGRWSEGQAPAWKERHGGPEEQVKPSPPQPHSAPVVYSPSVYSTIWSPSDAKKQKAQPLYVWSHQPHWGLRPTRYIHPSDESSRTLTFEASDSVLASVDCAQDTEQKSEEQKEELESAMLISKCEDLLPSRELAASSPSGDVTMPALHGRAAARRSADETETYGSSSASTADLKGGSTDTESATHGGIHGNTPPSDFHPADVRQYPNAMPAPLFGGHNSGRAPMLPASPPLSFPSILPTPPPGYSGPMMVHGPSGPAMFMMSDGSNLLTHFDVLNRHIMDAATSLHHAQAAARDQLLADVDKKHTDLKTLGDDHATVSKQCFDNIEQYLSTSAAHAESTLSKTEQLLKHVRVDLAASMAQLFEQNSQVLSRIDGLQKQIVDLGKKYEGNSSTIASEVARSMQNSASPYFQSGMSMPHAQSMQGQFMFMDQAGRMFAMNATQAQQMQQMQGGGHAMYGAAPTAMGKDDRPRRSDDYGGFQRNGGYGGGEYNRRGYDGFRSSSDPRLNDGKSYNEGATGLQRHA